jgi:uncharacterized Zn finger protein (UPF0148 family)
MPIEHCPSCGGPEIEVAGNKVHCKACDITFTVTPQGARVADLDPLGKDRERISKLEKEVEELKNPNRGTDASEIEEEADDEECEGFIKITDDDKPEVDAAGGAGQAGV